MSTVTPSTPGALLAINLALALRTRETSNVGAELAKQDPDAVAPAARGATGTPVDLDGDPGTPGDAASSNSANSATWTRLA